MNLIQSIDNEWNFKCFSVGYSLSHGPIQLLVSADVPHDLLQLMKGYGNMLLVIRNAELSSKTFQNLIYFSADVCDDDHLLDCSSVPAFVRHFKRYISLFNIKILMVIYEKFKSSTVEESVQKYKQQLDAFLSSTSIKQLKDAFQCQTSLPRDVESITLKLEETKSEYTLATLKKLAYHLFGITSKTMILFGVGQGCVAIRWLAPMAVVPILRKKAEQHSPEILSRLGVLELVIGLKVTSPEYQG